MIVVKLMGGLGNQMFQFAAAKALAIHWGVEVKNDVSFLQRDTEGKYTRRDYELDVFNLHSEPLTTEEQRKIRKFHSLTYRKLSRKFPFLFSFAYKQEFSASYDPTFFSSPKNTYLDGYWQSEKYFKRCEKTIREDFVFKNKPLGENADWARRILSCEAVSIHVRRGDYASNAAVTAFHGLCSPEYYTAAVARIRQRHPQMQLFFFSDDLNWVKNNLKFDIPMHYIDCNQGANSYEDMRLMTLCRHNIVANSSFSWWGAWLNDQAEKMIIAPRTWYASATINQQDIIPETWIKI